VLSIVLGSYSAPPVDPYTGYLPTLLIVSFRTRSVPGDPRRERRPIAATRRIFNDRAGLSAARTNSGASAANLRPGTGRRHESFTLKGVDVSIQSFAGRIGRGETSVPGLKSAQERTRESFCDNLTLRWWYKLWLHLAPVSCFQGRIFCKTRLEV